MKHRWSIQLLLITICTSFALACGDDGGSAPEDIVPDADTAAGDGGMDDGLDDASSDDPSGDASTDSQDDASSDADAGQGDGTDAGESTVELETLAITPIDLSLPVGSSEQLTATGTYSDESTQDLTDQVTWATDDDSVASIGVDGVALGESAGQASISATLDGVSDNITITVTAAELDVLEVTPSAPTLPLGTSQQLTVTGVSTDGSSEDLTEQVAWSSSDETVAVVSGDTGTEGILWAQGVGSTTITATVGGLDLQFDVTVTAAELMALAIDPRTVTLAAGTETSLVAIGTYSDDSTQEVTASATWSSGDDLIATVDDGGRVTADAAGETQITATLDELSAVATVTVTDATLDSISIEPTNPTLVVGTTQQLDAVGHFSDGTVQRLTAQATWMSDNEDAATVDSAGLVAAVAAGESTVSASVDGVTGQAVATVVDATLENIEVAPANETIAMGTTLQFTAIGTFDNGSTQDLTDQVSWMSDDDGVATVSASGLATGEGVGSTQISVTFDGVTGSTSLSVSDATLEQIEVTPSASSIAAGTKQQFLATGTFSDSSTQDLTTQVTWSSDDTEIATISNAAGSEGLATSLAEGTVTIVATLDGVEGTATLTVTAATLSSLTVTPQNVEIAAGTKEQYTAIGTFSDDSQQDLTQEVAWASDNQDVAAISNGELNAGLAEAIATGTANISATLDGVSSSTGLTVTDAVLESISVEPIDASIAVGSTLQYAAVGTFSDGSTQELTDSVAWGAEPGHVASISNVPGSKGLARGNDAGTATISASLDGVQGSTSLNVTSGTLSSIRVEPVEPSVAVGTELQFVAIGVYSDESEQDLTQEVTWSSSDEAVATISNAFLSRGVASAEAAGEATITASYEGVHGSTSLVVTEATLESIVVTPAEATLETGDTQQFIATGVFSDESEQDITAQVDWSVADGSVAWISELPGSEGEATGSAAGETTVSAVLDEIEGTATLTVTAPAGQ